MITKNELTLENGRPSVQSCEPHLLGANPPPSEFRNDPINILLVDDEPKNLTALETILDDPGYRLVRAESAEQALLVLLVEEFAVMVLDIRMPGMNGFELAQMIKQRKKTAEVPIIFLTAYYNEDQHTLEGYGTGAVDYLHKPVNCTILRSKVAVFAELHRKTRESVLANRALLAEVAERRRVEQELHELNTELEHRIDERASDLLQANRALCESEERLRLAQSASGVGVWDWQAATGETWWSGTMWAIYGAQPVPPAEVQNLWSRLLHPEDRPRVEAQMTTVVGGGAEAGFRDEFRIVRPDGQTRWVESIARLERNAAGQPARMSGVSADITERKRLENELRQFAVELSESDRHKNEFLAMLAHELRNPLAPIRNALQILRMSDGDGEAVKSAAEMMERQVRQMVRLVDDLLDVSRISRGKIELRRERIELASAVNNAVEAARSLAHCMGHDLTVTLPPQSVYLNADPIRLAQLVGNLLNNACKFTANGGRILLTVEQEGEQVVLRVQDTGIGIAADQLPRIFDIFTQVDTSLERSQSGLGIGLTLVKNLVEMHGGTVEAHSAGVGQGSEFVVRLPILVETSKWPPPGPTISEPMLTSARRILVVDDNQDSADSLAALLKMTGDKTHTAYDGLEAVEAAAMFRPNVVLLDIGLPKLNGYEAARKIREQPWGDEVVLIALTGWGQDEDRRRSSDAGFDRHLVKPVEYAHLTRLLAELVPNPN